MVRADLMDGIDYALRINRDQMKLPFGGVQMVFFGDLFQLSPVVEKEARDILDQRYGSPYFFSAKVFKKLRLRYVELNKNYRQSDAQFIDLLNKIRNKTQRDTDLDLLNERVRTIVPRDSKHCVILTTTNNRANAVNGTIAQIAALSSETIKVSINGSIHEVGKSSWEKIEYEYNQDEDKIVERIIGTFQQYPIKLAWAITIHKSQGQTFDNIVIDLGSGAFTHGQVYVGLSRCTALKGIILKRPVIARDIIFDERVHEFRNRFLNLI